MLYLYGDSHAHSNFKYINLHAINKHEASITMFRIGRDNCIINFNNQEHDANSILCFNYGEVDCRCHIGKQILLGRNEDDIIDELVHNYITTIQDNIKLFKKIIIIAIIPPTERNNYESLHGPIMHEFPFIGTDDERARYTDKCNNALKEACSKMNYIFFDPFAFYKRENGCFKFEYSDSIVHLGNNSHFLNEFMCMLEQI